MTILLGKAAQGGHPVQEGGRQPTIVEEQEGEVLIMEASTPLAEIGELLDIGLPTREFHSVGGLITSRLRRIPETGDTLDEAGYRFTVIEATSRAPTRIRVEALQL